jgi:hypothetical protein
LAYSRIDPAADCQKAERCYDIPRWLPCFVPALPPDAPAMSNNGNDMMGYWASLRGRGAVCRFTAKADTKRNNAMKPCPANGNLPPRPGLNH